VNGVTRDMPGLATSPLLAQLVAALALAALALYAVTGGADFGAGLWDRFASGPRKAQQRAVIEHALAPIWETNHVWLIFVVVLLFSAFPAAFAAIGTALTVPLTLALVGIVLRGAGFVFRHYGQGTPADNRRWGRIFGGASLIGPFFLATALAAVSGGHIRVAADGQVTAPAQAWWGFFPVAVGLFVVALFAFLAAVYLCVEADTQELRDDFRRRAIGAGLLAGGLSLLVRIAVAGENRRFSRALFESPWSASAQIMVAALALLALGALFTRRFHLARAAAVAQVVAVVVGWGAAQHPFLVAPDLTVVGTGAPAGTLVAILCACAAGALVLIPALAWLFHVFKRRPRDA
jgi:cytochrome d ubiquinol oxidase subunit II